MASPRLDLKRWEHAVGGRLREYSGRTALRARDSRWIRDALLTTSRDRREIREDTARMYLRGTGIEIGALNFPLRVPPGVHVCYVDYLPIETLRVHHAHLLAEGGSLVAPHVVDDGERLLKFDDQSLDFVVANHFIEHSEDPIGTLASHLRVLRTGGILFMAVPDKRATFDLQRDVTPIEHLIRDHAEGPDWSRADHYLEWARYVDDVAEEEIERTAADTQARGFSIHFHVFTPSSYLGMLLYCQSEGMPFELELFQRTEDSEFLTVLRKR